jgi:PAS domain S-box-containing protein
MAKYNYYHDLRCLDIYLMYEGKLDIKFPIKESSEGTKFSPHPLMSWDISGKAPCSVIDFWNIKEDIIKLDSFSKQYEWDIDFQKLLSLQYQALVLTDAFQQIAWVNAGFTEMTGYPGHEALGRTPRFLQGKNTSPSAKDSISKALKTNRPFTKKVLNYRKNQEEYICQLTIFPLLNKTKEITHFLALEVEVEH